MSPNVLIAGSVISTSPMTRFAVALAMFTALIGMVIGQPLGAAIVASVIGVAIGGSVNRYKTWEGSALVPGLRETMALFAIQISLCVWVILIFAALEMQGSFLAAIGICLLLIAIGLCVGAGDTRLIYFTFATFGIGGFVLYQWANSGPEPDFDSPLLYYVLQLAGLLMVFAGCGFLRHFWNLITIPRETGSCNHDDLQEVISRSSEGNHNHDSPQAGKSARPVVNHYSRTRKLIEYVPTFRIRDYAWLALLLAGLTGAAIYNRGNEDLVLFFQLTVWILLLFVPVASFMTRVPESFERLWIMGVATNRVETLRRKLGLSAWRCLAFLVFLAIGLAIQSPPNPLAYATTFSFMFVAFGLGAILLLVASKTYQFWVGHSNALMLVFALLCMTLTLATFCITNGRADFANSLVSSIGLAQSLIFSLLFAVLCWAICLLDGGRAMANDSALLE